MASPSGDESDEVFEDTGHGGKKVPIMTWEEQGLFHADSPRVGAMAESSDTEDEDGQVTARPASQDGGAGCPKGVEPWMNRATRRDALDLRTEEVSAPENTPQHSAGVLESAGELASRGGGARMEGSSPRESGENARERGGSAPARGTDGRAGPCGGQRFRR